MLDILIVEGNLAGALDADRTAGRRSAHEAYRESLALHRLDARFATIFAYAPERNPAGVAFERFDGIALTGSGVPWTANDPDARPYLDLLEKVFATGRPVVGSCWGLQTVAVLLGGTVGMNQNGKEVGIARDITLTQAGRAHWSFAGMPERFDQPTIHRDHVTRLPAKAVNLAGNAICDVQAMAYASGGIDYLGFLGHPERELSDIRRMHEERLPLPGQTVVLADFPDEPSAHVAVPRERTRVLANWLDHVEELKFARG